MAKNTCCGCLPVLTGAVLMGVLQSVIVVILLSTSAVLLERWHDWKLQYDIYTNLLSRNDAVTLSTVTATATISGSGEVITWRENGTWWNESGLLAFLEIHLTHHVAFYSLWLVFLAVYALSFKYYRPALVLPNTVMQIISIALIIILAGVLIAKMVFLNRQYEYESSKGALTFSRKADMDSRYTFYAVLLGCLVIGWIAEIVFLWIGIDFYNYLRDMQHTVYPASSSIQATVSQAPGHRETHVTTTTNEPTRLLPINEPKLLPALARGDMMA